MSNTIKFDRKRLPKVSRQLLGKLGPVRTRNRFLFQNPVLPGYTDIQNMPVYDSFSVAANTAFPTQTLLFQVPTGQSSKTLLNTSMRQAGILPAPDSFSVRAFRLVVQNDATIADMIALLYKCWLRFFVGDKDYFIGPAFLWTAGAGAITTAVSQVGATAPTGTLVYYSNSNGNADQRNIFSLTRPVQIGSMENFGLEINCPGGFTTAAAAGVTLGTGLNVYGVLDGELVRAVR